MSATKSGRVFWHGGQAGLKPGEKILPPSVTGAKGTLYDTAKEHGLESPARKDRVYVTTRYEAALLYAAVHPSGGAIYLVEPEGELVPDPDCDEPGLSWECESARIIRALSVAEKDRRAVIRAMLAGGVA